MNMTPKFKDLPADLRFEPGDQRRSGDHYGHAQCNRHDGNPDNKPGKILFSGKGDAPGDEKGKIQFEISSKFDVRRANVQGVGLGYLNMCQKMLPEWELYKSC